MTTTKETPQQPETPPDKIFDVIEFLVKEDPDTSKQPMPDLGQAITSMTYHNAEHQIYVDKQCYVDLNGLSGITQNDHPKLASYDFFLRPDFITSRQKLREALEKKMLVEGTTDSVGPMWRLDIQLDLITDGMRVEAANAINLKYPGANVSHQRIKLVPFRYLEVRADLGSGMQRVASLPSIIVTPKPELPPLGKTPNQISVRLIGNEKLLSHFVSDPKLEGRCFIKGLALKENILHLSADVTVKTGLLHVLSGNASWDQFLEFKSDTGRLTPNTLAGAIIPRIPDKKQPIGLKVAMKSYVTRSQFREISAVVATRVRGIILETNGTSVGLNHIRDKFLDHLLEFVSERKVAEIVKQGNSFVIDPRLEQDLGTDQYALLNATLKKHIDEKTDQKLKGGAFGIEIDKANKDELKDENDITWKAEGKVVVPKSIVLYQFNHARFEHEASRQWIEAIAKDDGLELSIPPAIGPFGVEVNVEHFRFVNCDDDDEDLKGFSLLVEFLDATGAVIPETTWEQRRGLISVGDADREQYRTPRRRWVPEGSGDCPTDFFIGTTKRVTAPVSKIRIKVWTSTDDPSGSPGEWHPFEKVVDPTDGGTITLKGGWVNGTTLDLRNGRHIEVLLTTKEL